MVVLLLIVIVWLVIRHDESHSNDLESIKSASRTIGMLEYKRFVMLQCTKDDVKLNFTAIDTAYVRNLYRY